MSDIGVAAIIKFTTFIKSVYVRREKVVLYGMKLERKYI